MDAKRSSFFAACIKCGTPSKSVLEKSGEYNNILMEVLQTVALANEEWNKTDITYISFDATKGFLPRVQTLEDFDAVIITGSGHSANDTHPWVLKLGSFIKAYEQKPDIRLFGVCFGHQIICQALFETHDKDALTKSDCLTPVVSRNPKGWEIGSQSIKLSPEFLTRFGPVRSNPESPSEMRLNLIHLDQVDPESLPKDFLNIGSSDLCEVQGIYKRGRVLTLQGHAEFDTDMVIEFGKPILGKAMDINRTQPDDHAYAATAILGFLREEAAEEGVIEEVVGEAMAEEAEEEVEEAAAAEEEAEETVGDGELIEEVAWDTLCGLFGNLTVEARGKYVGDSGAGEALGDTNN
ncbi:hypothetical protein V495_04533 [Pseudogymnoascus sp. VKM F-4514 (FW-929)]|nr:hypothetical protein V495_04533 [Pseudogymnoascus sp. VKM F-4514 (FW-929)]KFY57605.1 hypothetical protein V497_05449 [Pseudogymnoascus sp. VKM F-4516 (FW-969)]